MDSAAAAASGALVGATVTLVLARRVVRETRLYWQSEAFDQGFVAGQEAGPDRDAPNPYFEQLTGRSDG